MEFEDARQTLEAFIRLPYIGHELEWERLLVDTLRLELAYMPGVQIVIDREHWRREEDPVGYIRTVGQKVYMELFHLPKLSSRRARAERVRKDELDIVRERQMRDSGLYSPPTRDDDRDLPIGLPITGGLVCDPHGDGLSGGDYLDQLYGDGCERREPAREIAPDIAREDDPTRPDWDKVADIKGMTHWRRMALKYWAAGTSLDSAMDQQTTDSAKLAIQAAWRWLYDHWSEIESIVRGERQNMTTANQPTFIAPAEILQRYEDRRRKRVTARDWLPVVPRILDLERAAQYMHVPECKIILLVAKGRLQSVSLTNEILIDVRDLDSFIDSQKLRRAA